MPWKESHTVNERMHFVTRLEKGERMTDLCLEFGISRKTGHKIWSRYQGIGLVGLEDQSRAPKRIPHKTEPEIEKRLLEMRSLHPTWGGRKAACVGGWRERDGRARSARGVQTGYLGNRSDRADG